MNCLNLLDIDSEIKFPEFKHLIRVDNIYVGAAITSARQIEILKSLGVIVVVNLQNIKKTPFNDEEEFNKYGLGYKYFPIKDLSKIDFNFLQKFGELINYKTQKFFLYSLTGDRAAALLALNSCLVCGHPKTRAMEFGIKLGVRHQETINIMEKLFFNESKVDLEKTDKSHVV